jgi:hypothetical protein
MTQPALGVPADEPQIERLRIGFPDDRGNAIDELPTRLERLGCRSR